MDNPNLARVESYLGAFFVCSLTIFFGGLLMISVQNSEADIDVMSANTGNNKIVHLSESERTMLHEWIDDNNIDIPKGKGYRYLIKEYPDKPWLN